MPKIVEVQGLGNVEFPDTMDDSAIGAAIAKQMAPPPEPVGKLEAAARGATQGLTMGWGDEAEARWKSLFPKSMGGGDYKRIRDQLRTQEANARQQHPYIYGGSEALGSVLPLAAGTALTGGAATAPALARTALPLAAGQGALQGAGSSNADTARGLAGDSALGGGLGAVGYGLGQAVGSAGRGLVRWASGKATLATARASEKAAQEIADQIASARGSLGGEVQKGQRIVENLRRLGPELTPEQEAAAQELEKRLTASTLESLPGQASTIAAKDAELAALKSGASDALQTRKAELLSLSEAKQQAMDRLKRYGPPMVGSAVGSFLGGPLGGAVGSFAGAGTRPAIQSWRRFSQLPAVQKFLAEQMIGAVESPTARLLKLGLTRGLPAAATQKLVAQ